MNKRIILFYVLLAGFKAYGNDTTYYSILRNSVQLTDSIYSMESFQQLANCCERIITLYNDWLPYYYYAYACTNLSFIVEDKNLKETYCEKAQVYIDSAIRIKPLESELYVLQALNYFALMNINPMKNGPVYFPLANEALDKAEKLNFNNPRIYYLRGQSIMHTPKFMGGGKEQALPVLQKALMLYAGFERETTIHPHWGKLATYALIEKCIKESKDGHN